MKDDIKLTPTTKVHVSSNPTNKYRMEVTFDDGDDLNFVFTVDKLGEMLKREEVYREYMKRLGENWNDWCNPDSYQINELFLEQKAKDMGIDDDDEEAYEALEEEFEDFDTSAVWSWSNEYPDPMARADGVNYYYYDENGIEWNCKKEEL